MKKLFFVGVALTACLSAQAQIVSSSSRSVITQTVKHNDVIYVKAGVSLNNYVGKDANQMGSTPGEDVIVGFQKSFSSLSGLYWGLEGGIGTRGAKVSDNKESLSVLAHNLKITPIMLGYKFDIVDALTFDVHAGFGASCDLLAFAKAQIEDYSETRNLYELGSFQRFDIYAAPGITLWYKKIGLDFTYQAGFLKVAKDAQATSSNFLIRLAFRF